MDATESSALSVKYRPQRLKHFSGQEVVVSKIRGMLALKKFPQTILLQGQTGGGKTTLARIIARYVNCDALVNGEPCGECDSCKTDIKSHNDVHEVDCGNDTGIEFARKTVEQASFSPRSKYRVFILDEFHLASSQAKQLFLKPFEEPNKTTIWIVCTTNPEKLPAPIRNRMQVLEIKPIEIQDCVKILKRASKGEGFNLTDETLEAIAMRAGGQPRESLQALQNVMSYVNGAPNKPDTLDTEALIPFIKQAIAKPPYEIAQDILFSMYTAKYANSLKYVSTVTTDKVDFTMKMVIDYHAEATKFLINESLKSDNWVFNSWHKRLSNLKAEKKNPSRFTCSKLIKEMVTTYSSIKNYLVEPDKLFLACILDCLNIVAEDAKKQES